MSTPEPSTEKQTEFDMKTIQTLADAVTKAIGENKEGDKRFIDIARIPLICLSITSIHTSIEEIKEMMQDMKKNFVSHDSFLPVKYITFGLVGMIMTGVVGALLTLVLRQ